MSDDGLKDKLDWKSTQHNITWEKLQEIRTLMIEDAAIFIKIKKWVVESGDVDCIDGFAKVCKGYNEMLARLLFLTNNKEELVQEEKVDE